MARDWIKMRILLPKDPKVIRMAEFLSKDELFLRWISEELICGVSEAEKVTLRNVTAPIRNVTPLFRITLIVTGLLTIWGMGREKGRRLGNDLVLNFCSLGTLSEIAGIPNFGLAMAHVGWALEGADNTTILPNYYKDDFLNDSNYREKGRERQLRYRERRKKNRNVTHNVTHNVTQTLRGEVGEKTSEDKVTLRNVTSNVSVTIEKMRDDDDSIDSSESIESSDDLLDSSESSKSSPISSEEILKIWNDQIAPILGARPIRKLHPKRLASIRKRLKVHPNLFQDILLEAQKVGEFLLGSSWISFDWFLSENNLTKYLEGNYRDKSKPDLKDVIRQIVEENGNEVDSNGS